MSTDVNAICEELLATLAAGDTQLRVAAANLFPYRTNARMYRTVIARSRVILASAGVPSRAALAFAEFGSRDEDTEELLHAAVGTAARLQPQAIDDGPEGSADASVPLNTDESAVSAAPIEEELSAEEQLARLRAEIGDEAFDDELDAFADESAPEPIFQARGPAARTASDILVQYNDMPKSNSDSLVSFSDEVVDDVPDDESEEEEETTGSITNPFVSRGSDSLVSFDEPLVQFDDPDTAEHDLIRADDDDDDDEPDTDMARLSDLQAAAAKAQAEAAEKAEAQARADAKAKADAKAVADKAAADAKAKADAKVIADKAAADAKAKAVADKAAADAKATSESTAKARADAVARSKADAEGKSKPPNRRATSEVETFDLMPTGDLGELDDPPSEEGLITGRNSRPEPLEPFGEDVSLFEDTNDAPSASEVIVRRNTDSPATRAPTPRPAVPQRAPAKATISPDGPRASATISPDAPRANATISPDAPRAAATISPDAPRPKPAETARPSATISPDAPRPNATLTPDAPRPGASISPDGAKAPAKPTVGAPRAVAPAVASPAAAAKRPPVGGPVPQIREGSDAKPRSAAIQLGANQQTAKVLGLEEEEEPLEMGEADGDIPAGDGFTLQVEEYETVYEDEPEELEEEPEPELPKLPSAPVGPTSDEVRALLIKAEEARYANDMSAAVQLYSDVLDGDPDNVEAHIKRGELYLDLGDYARAMSDFTVAEDLAPESPDVQVAIGNLYFSRKDYRKAVDYFNEALTIAPNHAMAFCRRGISHYYRKAYNEAVDDLVKAQKLNPEIENIATFVSMAKKKAVPGKK